MEGLDQDSPVEPAEALTEDVPRVYPPPYRPLTGGGAPLSELIGVEAVQELAAEQRRQRIEANQARFKKWGRRGMIRRAHGIRTRPLKRN